MRTLLLSETQEKEILGKITKIKHEIREATHNNLDEAKKKGLQKMLRTYYKLWSLLE